MSWLHAKEPKLAELPTPREGFQTWLTLAVSATNCCSASRDDPYKDLSNPGEHKAIQIDVR
eukprot:7490636-Heterocapsa_arctica.AAC.1